MARTAERVYTDQRDIAALEGRLADLPDEARVEIILVDGGRVTGAVAMRPTIQSFFDADGREGLNGVVRIDRAGEGEPVYFWLDQILEITRLDATAAEATQHRGQPAVGGDAA